MPLAINILQFFSSKYENKKTKIKHELTSQVHGNYVYMDHPTMIIIFIIVRETNEKKKKKSLVNSQGRTEYNNRTLLTTR